MGYPICSQGTMRFTHHYATLRGLQDICCASVSNIDSVVACTRNIPGVEPFILWLPGLQDVVCYTENRAAVPTRLRST